VYGNLQKLYPELSVQYSNTRDVFRSTITDVGERFIQQLKRLIAGNTDYLKDETIQERVRKGVAYFLEQIERLCTPLQEASNVEIDNKETRKTVKNALDKWNEDLRIKLSTLQGCQEGFTIPGYLSAKAKASIEQPPAPTARKRSEKASEPAKLEISADIKHPELYASLKHWRYEVATEKGLPPYTILQQKALIGVVNTLPASGRDLLKIPGIGKKIVEYYGAKLLEIVDEYRKKQ
jgi:superfamily II DNA helicase RecQ